MQTHLSELIPSLGIPELTHKLHTAGAEQSRIVFPDVSDGFLHQLFNVLHAHSFPRGAHLKRNPADKPLWTSWRAERGALQGRPWWGRENFGEKLKSRVPEEGGTNTLPVVSRWSGPTCISYWGGHPDPAYRDSQ